MESAQFYNRYIPTDGEFYGKFVQLTTYFEQLNFADLYRERNLSFLPFVHDSKDDLKAQEALQEGHESMLDGKSLDALNSYTKALSLAASVKYEGLALVARTRALEELKLKTECLTDCKRAMKFNISKEINLQLTERINRVEEFSEGMPYHQKNPEANGLGIDSWFLNVDKTAQGNHVISAKTICVGDVLEVEKPLEVCLKRTVQNHCHGCLTLCYNLIPCAQCTQALYCGEECKDVAYKKYHRFECPILATLNYLLIPESHMICIRLILSQRARLLMSFPLEGLKKLPKEKTFSLSLAASFICHLLKRYTNFCFADNIYRKEMMYLLIGLGLKFAHVTELSPNKDSAMVTTKVGYGLYTKTSFFGHSCFPNVQPYYYGTTMVMRAIRSIRPGDECYCCYGSEYYERPRFLRQKILSLNSHLTCTCRACIEEWKQLDTQAVRYPSRAQIQTSLRLISQDPEGERKSREFGVRVMAEEEISGIPTQRQICVWRIVRFNYSLLANCRFL